METPNSRESSFKVSVFLFLYCYYDIGGGIWQATACCRQAAAAELSFGEMSVWRREAVSFCPSGPPLAWLCAVW